MPYYFYLAIKQLFPSGRKFNLTSVFYLLSVVGVALGVMALVISQSIMGGYGRIWREKILDTNGHIRIQSPEPICNVESLLKKVDADPGVAASAPYAEGVVMLQHENIPAFPVIRGIDLDRTPDVLPLNDFLIPISGSGSVEDLDDDSVLLSGPMMRTLRCFVGSTVELYTPLMMEKLKEDELLLPRELEVVGVFETGWTDFDANAMIVTLGLMQELYDLGDCAHGISIRVKDDADEREVAARLQSVIEPYQRAATWDQMYEEFLWILGFEKVMIILLTIPINLISAFVIVCAQLLAVIRKTREIGLLNALGAKPQHFIAGYCFQGAALGFIGSMLGLGIALSFLYFRNEIAFTVGDWFGQGDFVQQFYSFAYLPVHYSVSLWLVIIASAVSLSTLASIIPAMIAASRKPADALRAE